MNRILILGASGFIGNALYKELYPYFDVYGTYFSQNRLADNQVFYKYEVGKDDVLDILEKTRPNYIISALTGAFSDQYNAHVTLANYVQTNEKCHLIFLSSSYVFDGKFRFPSYEDDLPLAESDYGKYKISVEKLIKELPVDKFSILRLPLVLGVNSPTINQLRQAIQYNAIFEVFPNLIISVTTANKLAQQVHYIINKNLTGIFHLASNDVIHHEDLFIELTAKLGDKQPIFKKVFSRNDDTYLAILPKRHKLPKQYRISVAKVVVNSVLPEEISTYKT